MEENYTICERNMMGRKKKTDQLETFFIVETTKLIGLYDTIRSCDPRDGAITGNDLSQDDELSIVKNSWATLVTFAKLYGYRRFDTVDPDLEKFYMEKIHV